MHYLLQTHQFRLCQFVVGLITRLTPIPLQTSPPAMRIDENMGTLVLEEPQQLHLTPRVTKADKRKFRQIVPPDG